MKKLIYTALLGLLFSGSLLAQDWIVPEDQKSKLAESAFVEANIESGTALYLINCKSCHGMPGEGNYTPLVPIPGDPATEKIQNNSDGELYNKIREGRGLMPSFKKVLTIPQVWDIISYLRSFNPDYVQQIAIAAANNRWTDIKIALTHLEADKLIKANVTGLEEGVRTPVSGADIRLEATRRFGNLQIGEVVRTNEQGLAYFEAPGDLPGDPEGNIDLLVLLDNEEEFGIVKLESSLPVGEAFTPVSLTAERAMWNINKKAPIWLILTYVIGVFTVWGFIMFVMLQLRAIFKLGEKEEQA